jgi:hypothetical protein
MVNQLIQNIPGVSRLRLLLFLLLLEWLTLVFSGVSFTFLTGDRFFSFGVDPLYWLFFGAGIPQAIVSSNILAILADVSITVLILALIRYPAKNLVALGLFILMLCYYTTLTGFLTHRNYQAGIFLVLIPFIFKKPVNRQFAFESVRYFLLFFYISAALLKLVNGSLWQGDLFSGHLAGQFAPYHLEGNTGIRTTFNLYLLQHELLARLLYIGSFCIELACLIGIFTRKWDNLLAGILLLFHAANWFIMDIGAIGQLAFICLLLLPGFVQEKESGNTLFHGKTQFYTDRPGPRGLSTQSKKPRVAQR